MTQPPTGTLIGVGVGPGDPELLTIKAVKAIQTADVIAFHARPGGAVSYTHLTLPTTPYV